MDSRPAVLLGAGVGFGAFALLWVAAVPLPWLAVGPLAGGGTAGAANHRDGILAGAGGALLGYVPGVLFVLASPFFLRPDLGLDAQVDLFGALFVTPGIPMLALPPAVAVAGAVAGQAGAWLAWLVRHDQTVPYELDL